MDAAEYEKLAESDPNRLTLIVEKGGLEGVDWQMACEIAGGRLPTAKIQGPLVRQLQRATNATQFYAVMSGLSYHMDNTTLAILQRLVDKSDNPTIRQLAMEVIEQDGYNRNAEDDEPKEDDILYDD